MRSSDAERATRLTAACISSRVAHLHRRPTDLKEETPWPGTSPPNPSSRRSSTGSSEFCREEVEPLEYVFPYAVRSPDPGSRRYVRGLQQQVKDQGLWAIFLDEELGGPGFGQLKLGLLNEVIGRYPSAPQMFGAAAPDTGNMEMLAAYGTEEQKERWLKPLWTRRCSRPTR